MTSPHHDVAVEPATREFYLRVVRVLNAAAVPFLLGGAYAFQCYTGIGRHTKDLDLFLRKSDVRKALRILEKAGYPGEIVFPHWLAKAWSGGYFVDLIYNSGNGVAAVDEPWFQHATPGAIDGQPIRLCPIEEMIWSKAFIMERERYDGADVAHLLRAGAAHLDWERLLGRFGAHWRVLFAHLVLFGFIYPGERDSVPGRVMRELEARLRAESRSPGEASLCRGPLLSRAQYLVDTGEWEFEDARLLPGGTLSRGDIDLWTRGIAVDGPPSLPEGGA